MNETQKIIKVYREMLPGLRKRIMAAVMLLLISAVMVASASFAWVTVSTSPEVSSVTTTVAANGNLEIALATGDGKTAPGVSQIGDSSASQEVTLANLTWGNLINLSDPSYGLDNLVLRPAQLNTTALLTSPLYGALYSEDGRIGRLTSNFSYTSWVPPQDLVEGYFGLANSLGVRAVSSTKRQVVGFYQTYYYLQDDAVGANTTAGNDFLSITQDAAWMDILAKLMGIHMSANLNSETIYKEALDKDGTTPLVTQEDLIALIGMYDALIGAHEQEAAAIAKQLNFQLYAAYGGDSNAYVDWTDTAVLTIAEDDARFVNGDFVYTITSGAETKTIKISQMQTFIKDYNMLKADVQAITTIKNGGDYRWTSSGLNKIINRLMIIDDCLVKLQTETQYKTVKQLLAEFSSDIWGAMGYMGKKCDVIITNGVLKNFEQRTGTSIKIENMKVTAKMYVSTMGLGEQKADIYAYITTSAEDPSEYSKDDTHASTLYTGTNQDAGEVTAQDTYALAVDFWVRTNAASSHLVLEGNILYDKGKEVVVTGKSANGETVNLYTLTRVADVEGEGAFGTVTNKYTLYPVQVGENDTKPVAYYSARAASLGEYVDLSEDDIANLKETGNTVTAADGNVYEVFSLVRTEPYMDTETINLYKVDTANEDGTTTTTWYRTDGTEYTTLGDGDEPVKNGQTLTLGEVTYDLYSWDEYVVKEQEVGYDLYRKELDTIWCDAENHNEFNLNDGETPTQKMETVYTVIGYEGENRVWNGEDKSYITVDATTQGSGSCYVYYADSPEDQARSLKLLAAMNVAFIDANGALLAEAKMDTEHIYAEPGGRVTVPLKLTSGVLIGENGDTGEAIYGITALEKNVATRITALVYLDGTLLGNEDVLAAADIQGRLNIQFGSNQNLRPLNNEDLENDELRVTASVDKATFNYDTHQGEMKVKTTVSVDGDAPNTMTGFFLRQISATQGSREQEMTFTEQPDGTWTADYTFESPGVYVLRSVRLDGVDYDLGAIPTVTVTGFGVESLNCTQADENNHINIMTAAGSSAVNLNLKFVTNDPNKMPQSVQARFLRDDGTAVNVNFTFNPTTQIWSGIGMFLSSGEYDLDYLVLDGKHTELDSEMQYTASITLGMRVAVYTTSPSSFKYLPSEMADNQKLLGMQVKIMDNTGKEMVGLNNVKLTYRMQGSTARMDTNLTWNGGREYYIGNLKTLESGGPGTWIFESVTVGGNTLTNATSFPTFALISPEPPSYVELTESDKLNFAYQFKPNGGAYLTAKLKYSSTASVMATFKNEETGKTQNVLGTLDSTDANNVAIWKFTIPNNIGKVNGAQDGNWTMTDIYVWDYFNAAGDFITIPTNETTKLPDENADLSGIMHVDMTDENYKSKVVQTVYVTFADQSKDFGKDASGNVTGAFMEGYTISGLTVTIKDFEGPLKGVDGVEIAYTYGGDSIAKGGYSGGSIPENGVEVFKIEMTSDAGGAVFTQSKDQIVRIAGTYAPTFSFNLGSAKMYIDSVGISKIGSVPEFTVWSVVPNARITAAGYASASSQTAASFTDHSTTVYAHEYKTTTTVCGSTLEYKAYHQPYVKIELSGYGNATNASLTFVTAPEGGEVLLYTEEGGRTKANGYEWTANGICTRWVGQWDSRTGDDKRTTAGNLTASTLVLTYGGETYTVSMPFAINNPN